MPSTRNPVTLTPEERTRELARLLAMGLVRLGTSLLAPASWPTTSGPENAPEFAPNRLAVAGQKSVTVTGG